MKNIIVLGAGFGGLRTAIDIDRGLKSSGISEYRVILIDQLRNHTFTPLLYEVATAHSKYFSREILENLVSYPIDRLIQNTSIKFRQDEIVGIDLHDFGIRTKSGPLPFEYLVLALGAEVIHFGIPGLKENAFHLKTFEDAFAIRARVETLRKRSTPSQIIIGGGGSTGVELAAEMARLTKRERKMIELLVLEATPTLLPGFDSRVVKKIHARLLRLGVKIMTGNPVASLSFKEVTLKNGVVLPHDFFIWTGGVGASNLTQHLAIHLQKGEKNRLEIAADLTCKPQDLNSKTPGFVYAIGDIACILNPESNRMVPLVARAAIEQGRVAAKNIVEKIKMTGGVTSSAKKFLYRPLEYPYVIPAGGKFAVCKIGPFIISGFFGWVIKNFVELNYFRGIMSLWQTKKLWLKIVRVFSAND